MGDFPNFKRVEDYSKLINFFQHFNYIEYEITSYFTDFGKRLFSAYNFKNYKRLQDKQISVIGVY